jgi:tubulin-folding cofactor B
MMQSAPDISVRINVPADSNSNSLLVSSERRVSPAWTVEQLKAKLEPITGIPPSCQKLQTTDQFGVKIPLDDDASLVGSSRYGLRRDSEIEVCMAIHRI